MALIAIQEEKINVEKYYEALKEAKYGGIVVFVGTVREWTGNTHTTSMRYTAYKEMALKEMAKLAENIEKKDQKVVMVHRIGDLYLKDEAVFIGVAAKHRHEAFVSCESLIDDLKKTVPIWKQEFNEDGISWGGHDGTKN